MLPLENGTDRFFRNICNYQLTSHKISLTQLWKPEIRHIDAVFKEEKNTINKL